MGLIISVDPTPVPIDPRGIQIGQGFDILPVSGEFEGPAGTAGIIFWGFPVIGSSVRIQGAGIDQTKTFSGSGAPIFYVTPLTTFTAAFAAPGYESGSATVTSPGAGLIRPYTLTFTQMKVKVTFNINVLPVDTAINITHGAQILDAEGTIPAGGTSLVLEVFANGSYSFFANPLGSYDDKFQTFSTGTSPLSFTLRFGPDATERVSPIHFFVSRTDPEGGAFVAVNEVVTIEVTGSPGLDKQSINTDQTGAARFSGLRSTLYDWKVGPKTGSVSTSSGVTVVVVNVELPADAGGGGNGDKEEIPVGMLVLGLGAVVLGAYLLTRSPGSAPTVMRI